MCMVQSSQQTMFGHLDINETGPFPQIKYKINSKQITDLKIRAKLIKFLEENTGIVFVTQSDNGFLNMTPRPQATKGNIIGLNEI